MPYTFSASARTSHRYRDGRAHLDCHKGLGFTVKVVAGREWWDRNRDGEVDYDASTNRRLQLTASRPATRLEMLAAVGHFTRGCRCEHDCCSHYFGGASLSTLRPRGGRRKTTGAHRRWTVVTRYAPNV